MNMNKFFLLFSFAFVILWSTGCNKDQSSDSDQNTSNNQNTNDETDPVSSPVLNYGFQEGTKYSNDYFGITAKVPEGWYIQSREENSILENIGRQTTGQAGEGMSVTTPIGELQVIYLISTLKFDPGTSVTYNPGINVIANNLTQSDSVISDQVYLQKLKEQLEAFPNFTTSEAGISTVNIGGKKLATMGAETKLGEILVKQTYFAKVIKEYAIQITISYTNEEEKTMLLGALEDFKFE